MGQSPGQWDIAVSLIPWRLSSIPEAVSSCPSSCVMHWVSLPAQSSISPPTAGGLHIIPGGRTAGLERDADGRLVARADTVVTDEMMFALIDSGRR